VGTHARTHTGYAFWDARAVYEGQDGVHKHTHMRACTHAYTHAHFTNTPLTNTRAHAGGAPDVSEDPPAPKRLQGPHISFYRVALDSPDGALAQPCMRVCARY